MNKFFSTLLKSSWFPYLAGAVISFIVILVWFNDGKLFFFADSGYPLNSELAFSHFQNVWKNDIGGGQADYSGPALLPLYGFLALLSVLGFSAVTAQAIFFYIILVATFSSAIYLIKYVAGRYSLPTSNTTLAILGFFYTTSLYVATNSWRNQIFLYIFYALMPLVIRLYLQFLHNGKLLDAVWAALLGATLLSPAMTNISYFFVLLIIALIISFASLSRKKITEILVRNVLFFVVWIGINIWYLLPQLMSVGSLASKATTGDASASVGILSAISSQASLLKVLTLQGYYSLYDQLAGPWYTWAGLFTNGYLGVVSIIFLILLTYTAAMVLITKKFVQPFTIGLALVLVGGFLAKGSHPPFGGVYISLLEHFPMPFLSLRAAYEKLGISVVLGYLVIIPIAFAFIKETLSLERFRVVVFAVSLAFVAISYPMITGLVHPKSNGIRPSAQISIPAEYYEMANTLSKQSDFVTLSLPLHNTTWSSFLWNEGQDGVLGSDPLRLLTYSPIISAHANESVLDKFDANLERELLLGTLTTSSLNERSIKHILIRKDINTAWLREYGKRVVPNEVFIKKLAETKGLKFVRDDKYFTLFENIDSNLQPLISTNGDVTPMKLAPTAYELKASEFDYLLQSRMPSDRGWVLIDGKCDKFSVALQSLTGQMSQGQVSGQMDTSWKVKSGESHCLVFKPQSFLLVGSLISLLSILAFGYIALRKNEK